MSFQVKKNKRKFEIIMIINTLFTAALNNKVVVLENHWYKLFNNEICFLLGARTIPVEAIKIPRSPIYMARAGSVGFIPSLPPLLYGAFTLGASFNGRHYSFPEKSVPDKRRSGEGVSDPGMGQ